MDENFLIKFGGEGNIKVETLTSFLNNYQNIIYKLNREFGYSDDDLVIEVSPPEYGSFKIKLSPKFKKDFYKLTHNPTFAASFAVLFTIFINNQNNISIEDVRNEIEVSKKYDKELVNLTFNVYQKTEIKRDIKQSFKIISDDENIENLEVLNNENKILEVPKEKFIEYAQDNNEVIEEEIVNEKLEKVEAVVVIKTICFEGTAKWEFIWRDRPIKASITDKDFLKRIDSEPFYRGDRLIAIIEFKKIFDDNLKVFIEDTKSYKIIEVKDHKRKDNNDKTLTLNL